jgi:serine/threonine protein kinase
MRDLSGTTLGNYEVVERLAAGGMAIVYRAVQHPLGREVALKVLTPALVDEVGFMQRFEIEAKTLARLDHPNILPIYDFGAADDVVFLATPLAQGGTLRQLMDSGPLEPVRAWRYLREVGDALQHAHEAGVIHRDLKPQNVLVHADGRAMLADFGLARNAATPADLTGYGFAIGTPGYMAPEQVLAKGIDHRADIYALGVLTFEMLTGKMPYADGTPMEIAYATLNEPIPSACDLNPILPFELDMLLQRVLAKDPEERPATMRQLVAELGRLPQRRSPGARRPGSAPTAPAASTAPATAPRAPATHRITLRAPSTAAGSAVQTLDQLGIKRIHGTQRYSLNSHFANAVRVACEVATGRWPEVAEAAGLSRCSRPTLPTTTSTQPRSRT